MKNEDIFYAMSFIDEDLIEEAAGEAKKAVVTPVKTKKKARIMPLIAPIAAVAAVLVIGGIVFITMNGDMSKDYASERSRSGHNSMDEEVEAIVGDEPSRDVQPAGNAVADDVDGFEDDSDEVKEEEVAELMTFSFRDREYIVVATVDEDDAEEVMGMRVGRIDDEDSEYFDDAEVYIHVEDSDCVVVFVEDTNTYYIAELED